MDLIVFSDTPSKDVAEQSLDRRWFPDSLTPSEFNRIMLDVRLLKILRIARGAATSCVQALG